MGNKQAKAHRKEDQKSGVTPATAPVAASPSTLADTARSNPGTLDVQGGDTSSSPPTVAAPQPGGTVQGDEVKADQGGDPGDHFHGANEGLAPG